MTHEDTLLALLNAHEPSLRGIAVAYAGQDGEEEDLYQEILLQVWRSLPSFRGDSTAGTWLYRVALNTALAWRRKATRKGSRNVANEPGSLRTEQAGRAPSRSQADILMDFLDTLNGPNRAVLLLYMEGRSYQQIADVTGLSVNAVGTRLHRMKQAFADQFVEGR